LLEKEVTILKRLQHERIVMYHGTTRSKTRMNIFMEYMPGVSKQHCALHFMWLMVTCNAITSQIKELPGLYLDSNYVYRH